MPEEIVAAPVAEVETQVVETPEEAGTPAVIAEEPKQEAAPGLKPEEIAALKPEEVAAKYKALTRKLKTDPNFKFTDEDSAIYDAHTRNKMVGGAKTLEPQAEIEVEDEDGSEEAPSEEAAAQPAAIPEPLTPLMQKLGVQTPEELAAAVENVHGKANEYFTDNQQMFQKITNQEQTLNAAHQILMGVIAGDPQAIQTARNIARQSGAKIPGLTVDLNTIQDPNTRQALLVLQQENEALKAQQTKVLSAQEQHVQRVQQEAAQRSAQANLVQEFTGVAAKFPALGLSPAEVHAGLNDFFKSGKVPEKLAPLMKVVELADKKGYSLEDAMKIMQFDQIPSMVQQAQVNGRKSLLNQQPSRTLAGQEPKSGEFREFTFDQVKSMLDADLGGQSTYPKAWTENGIFRSNKAPKYVVNWINQLLQKS